jgi:hypothetical protein
MSTYLALLPNELYKLIYSFLKEEYIKELLEETKEIKGITEPSRYDVEIGHVFDFDNRATVNWKVERLNYGWGCRYHWKEEHEI